MKKFTKLMSLVLACAMLFAIAIPVASASAADEKVEFKVEVVESTAGAKGVLVKLFASVEPHWSAVGLTFNFDPAKLIFKNFTWNGAITEQLLSGKAQAMPNDEHVSEGKYILTYVTTNKAGGYEGYYNVDSDDNEYDYLGTFKFNVAEGVEGLAEITATLDKISSTQPDGSFVDPDYEITNGGVRIPEAPKPVVVEGIQDGAEINLYDGAAPAPTWTPESATATLNGEPYTAGTPINEVGEYELVVTGDIDSKTVNFSVVNKEPPYEGVDIVIETVSAKAGDKGVLVDLFVPVEPHWSAIGLTFNFDPAKLIFKNFTWNGAITEQLLSGKAQAMPNDEHVSEGKYILTYVTTNKAGGYEGYYNVDSDDNEYAYLGTFKFNVAEGVEDGLIPITATLDKISSTQPDGSFVDPDYRITNGGIEITSCQHEWVESGRTPATCEEDGAIHYVCTKDPTHTKDETIPALGHDWGEWEVTTPATCCAEGEETRVCKNDPTHVETRPISIDPEAHEWGEWEVTTPATCCAEGEETRVCKNDPTHVETQPIDIDTDAHEWGEWTVTTPATCEADGEQTRVCKNDPTHVETKPIPALDHDWGEWEVTTPATCEADGVETRVCKRDGCDEFETRPITMLGHDWEETLRVPATCEADGFVDYVCKNDPEHTKHEVLTALGHDWGEWEVTTPATCTEKGVETRVCKNDPTHIETRDIDPIDHAWGEWEVTTPATCVAEGEETRVCKNDPTHIETRPVAIVADAHAWGEWEVTKAATYEAEGVETRVCKNDPEHIETRSIPKLVKPDDDKDNDNKNTSDNGIAAIAVVALIASAAVVVFSRKKRLAK